jgi:hypothetical protein
MAFSHLRPRRAVVGAESAGLFEPVDGWKSAQILADRQAAGSGACGNFMARQ